VVGKTVVRARRQRIINEREATRRSEQRSPEQRAVRVAIPTQRPTTAGAGRTMSPATPMAEKKHAGNCTGAGAVLLAAMHTSECRISAEKRAPRVCEQRHGESPVARCQAGNSIQLRQAEKACVVGVEKARAESRGSPPFQAGPREQALSTQFPADANAAAFPLLPAEGRYMAR